MTTQDMTVEELRRHIWRLGGEHELGEAVGRSVWTVRAWLRGQNVPRRMAAAIRAVQDGRKPALSLSDFQWAIHECGGSDAFSRRHFVSPGQLGRWLRGDAMPPDDLLKELRDACFVTVSR